MEQVLCLSAAMTEALIDIQTPRRLFGRTIPLMPRLYRAEVLPGERLLFKGWANTLHTDRHTHWCTLTGKHTLNFILHYKSPQALILNSPFRSKSRPLIHHLRIFCHWWKSQFLQTAAAFAFQLTAVSPEHPGENVHLRIHASPTAKWNTPIVSK